MRTRLRGAPLLLALPALGGWGWGWGWCATAAAQERPIGPTVRAVAALSQSDQARLARDTAAARLAGVTREADGVLVAHVFVRLATPDPAPLLALGARLGTRVGTLVGARVPVAALGRLAADRSVVAVYGARRWRPINDLGTSSIGVAGLRRLLAPDDFSGPVGRGVIVGLVDTGLDFTHPDFLVDSLGRSRVLYLWDQTLDGPGPGTVGATAFSYGIECRQEDLGSAAGCPSRETVGHGTHVLGTAAGDGSATNGALPAGRFAGVAPGADLIAVKTTFLPDAVVDGVNYIFSRAAQLGRPAVVNLSLGSQWGPHDGTLPEEEALDSLVGPGRIVVAAAGNDGDNGNTTPPAGVPPLVEPHLHGSALLGGAAGDTATFQLAIPAYTPEVGSDNDYVVLQLWYAAADSLTVTVIRPDSSSVTSQPTRTLPPLITADGAAGQVQIQNGSESGIALTGDNVAYIALGDLGGGTDPRSGIWTIKVASLAAHSGDPVHLWLADGLLGGSPKTGATLVAGATNGYLVSAPATASRVLAAAAYVTRLSWTDVNGVTRDYTYQELPGDLLDESSPGPRRDGVLKPDLAAPGKGIASSLSRFDLEAPSARILPDGRHWVMEGTSMAAPFVTGAVALLLERKPTLTPEEARTLLTAAARTDSFTLHSFDGGPGGTPNPSWGFGKLYVPPALDSLVQFAALDAGSASDAIAGRLVPSGSFRVLHLLVIGDPDSATVLDTLWLTAAGSVNEGVTLAGLAVYRDPTMSGVVPAGATPVAVASFTGDNPRVLLRLGPDTILAGDTLAFVFTTRLDSGVAVPSGQTVRFDVASANDTVLRYAASRAPVAVQGVPFRGPVVTLQSPGELAMHALPLGDTAVAVSSAPGSRFPVLRAELAAGGEPFVVQQVGLAVTGADPSAMVRVILDLNRNGVVDDAEPVLADTTAPLSGDTLKLLVAPPNLLVPAGGSVQFVVDLRTSGAAPNGARFSGAIAPALVHSLALYSGLADRQAADGVLSSGIVHTSLLGPGEALNLSENPVRGSSVIINYAGVPKRVAIYTFTGRRVRDFASPPAGNVVWDLTADDGRPVVNGVYVVVLDFGGSVVRHRLFVARRPGP